VSVFAPHVKPASFEIRLLCVFNFDEVIERWALYDSSGPGRAKVAFFLHVCVCA